METNEDLNPLTDVVDYLNAQKTYQDGLNITFEKHILSLATNFTAADQRLTQALQAQEASLEEQKLRLIVLFALALFISSTALGVGVYLCLTKSSISTQTNESPKKITKNF